MFPNVLMSEHATQEDLSLGALVRIFLVVFLVWMFTSWMIQIYTGKPPWKLKGTIAKKKSLSLPALTKKLTETLTKPVLSEKKKGSQVQPGIHESLNAMFT